MPSDLTATDVKVKHSGLERYRRILPNVVCSILISQHASSSPTLSPCCTSGATPNLLLSTLECTSAAWLIAAPGTRWI